MILRCKVSHDLRIISLQAVGQHKYTNRVEYQYRDTLHCYMMTFIAIAHTRRNLLTIINIDNMTV